MTTVAWDGKTLAADSQTTTGSIRGTAAKIAKSRDGFLVAGSGDWCVIKTWINWVLDGMPSDKQPDHCKESNIIVIDPRGHATVFEDVAVALPVPRKQWAIGSGSDLALGAMAMGADARTAVKVAAKFDVYTGGRIVVLTPGKAT
jgi:ATP-dependent protease HslVU (ClpYQ) peptidase subunit